MLTFPVVRVLLVVSGVTGRLVGYLLLSGRLFPSDCSHQAASGL